MRQSFDIKQKLNITNKFQVSNMLIFNNTNIIRRARHITIRTTKHVNTYYVYVEFCDVRVLEFRHDGKGKIYFCTTQNFAWLTKPSIANHILRMAILESLDTQNIDRSLEHIKNAWCKN